MLLAEIKASGWNPTRVIEGECPGFDFLGRMWAERNGVPVTPLAAKWRVGHSLDYEAGKKRNVAQAAEGEGLISIWDELSRGTKHQIECFEALGKPTSIWSTWRNCRIVRAPLGWEPSASAR